MARLNTVKSFRGTSKTEDGCLTCSKCGTKIKPGDSYRWWKNRAPGMRGGIKRVRCSRSECYPRPSDIEGNPKRSALMAAAEGFSDDVQGIAVDGDTTPDDIREAVEQAVQGVADAVRDVAGELQDGADNIESGFGTATYQSEELAERAQEMESKADELENWMASADPPDEEEATQDELVEYLEALREEADEAVNEGTELV